MRAPLPLSRLLALPLLLGSLAACGPAAENDAGPAMDDEATEPSATPIAQGTDAGTASSEATPAASAPTVAPAAAAAGAAKPTHPGLAVDTVDHGRFDLAEKRGRWVVVNFWATWCAPCLKEIPDLNALDAKREDLEIIGLAYEEITPEAMRAFYAEKVKPEYPVSIVDPFMPPADFDTPRGLPFTVLIDPQGGVAHQFLGPVTGAEIEATISEVSAASATPPTSPPA
jgi:thiol-disulfide isomerase/thioredoxin